MANFAIIFGNQVTNVIIADNLVDAQEASPDHATVVETTEAGVGWSYDGSVFTAPQPYPSWTLVDNVWVAPTPRPTNMGHVIWDEPTASWIKG